ncbi:MAG: electron transport complex subunit E [Pseudomonadota bacterium]
MANQHYIGIAQDGLWKNNLIFVQMLGLCPLLAVSNTAINGLGLGLATLLVLTCSNVTVSLIRNLVRPEVRVSVFVVVIASFVTAIDLAMNAFLFELHHILGIFIPLIVTNCGIIGRAEAFASKHNVAESLVDGIMMGSGFLIALVVLGAVRELIGMGTIFSQAHLMFGEGAHWLTLHVIEDYRGFLLAILPPGAFICLGFLVALKNLLDQRKAQRVNKPAVEPIPAAE